jgi:hypothetical protein
VWFLVFSCVFLGLLLDLCFLAQFLGPVPFHSFLAFSGRTGPAKPHADEAPRDRGQSSVEFSAEMSHGDGIATSVTAKPNRKPQARRIRAGEIRPQNYPHRGVEGPLAVARRRLPA